MHVNSEWIYGIFHFKYLSFITAPPILSLLSTIVYTFVYKFGVYWLYNYTEVAPWTIYRLMG